MKIKGAKLRRGEVTHVPAMDMVPKGLGLKKLEMLAHWVQPYVPIAISDQVFQKKWANHRSLNYTN